MSLIAVLRKKVKRDFFTTPSHAGEFFVFPKLRQFYKLDISETDAHEPQEALAEAEKKAAEIYKTKSTHFLLNGSSSGIIAAVLACVKKDEKVLIWDNAHPAHINAVKLAGAEAVFYELKKDEDWGIFGATPIEIIENKLKNKDIKAVIVTSPSYEGVVSDIKKIKEICSKYGAFLIVDEAHGALYPFCDKLPMTAIEQGADFVIQSLHKTAGGLNPTALLHYSPSPLEGDGKGGGSTLQLSMPIQQALEMITTTSPSYPLLASIEKNINFLNSQKGRKKILELIENIEKIKKNLANIEFYQDNDPTKILIKDPTPRPLRERAEFQREERALEIRVRGLSGYELSEYLYTHGIEDERTNEKSTMLLCGIGTSLKKLKRLEKILKILK